jgi:hypothetical protein
MPCHVVGDDRDVGGQVFERCIESFVRSLSGRGYCTVTLQQKRAMVTSFARWVRQRGASTSPKLTRRLLEHSTCVGVEFLSPGSVDGSGYGGPDPSTALSPTLAFLESL